MSSTPAASIFPSLAPRAVENVLQSLGEGGPDNLITALWICSRELTHKPFLCALYSVVGRFLVSGHFVRVCHFATPRYWTVREAMRLDGTPHSFRTGFFAHRCFHVHNGVDGLAAVRVY